MSGTCALVVPWYVSGFGYATAYKDIWNPRIDDVLPLEREPNNSEDWFDVAIKRTGSVVGHVLFNLAPLTSAFLRRDVNKGLVEVTDPKINRRAGYGLEFPCSYNFYGVKYFIDKLKELVEALRTDGRL